MPHQQQTEVVSLALSIGVMLIAALLGLWLRHDRRHREPDLAEDDARHFARQDLRRKMMVILLVILAVGLSIGSRVQPRIVRPTDPRTDQIKLVLGLVLFVLLWLALCLLLVTLLVLALRDWSATRLYADRHRQAIIAERLQIIQDEMRLRTAGLPNRNGANGPHRGPSQI